MSYFKQHKYHLIAFAVLLIVTGVSGYCVFTTHDTLNTTQDHQSNLAPEQFSTSTDTRENVTQNFSFDHKTDQNNLNTPTLDQIPNSDLQTPSDSEKINIETTDIESAITNPTTLTVSGEEYNTEFKEGMTVYELMQILSASSIKPFMFSGQDYGASMGYFVTEINGIKNDPQAGKYWIYYINGESAKIGISNHIINKGYVIEWKYEDSNM